jgi:S-adenosylmethionine-dependent methyltransferase
MWREKMTANADHERFLSGARDYAAYLETPEGRLRLDLAFANLQEVLPTPRDSSRALDLGAGTGTIAVRLARLGFHVTLLDSSPEMLDIAKRAAQEAGVAAKITLKHGDAAKLADFLRAEPFDVIVCHNLLEYLDDPGAVLRSATGLMRNSSARLSIVVRSRAGEIFKTAIQSGDLEATENLLTAQWGRESLYGGSVRLFTPDELLEMSRLARLEVIAKHGVRVVSDYLPQQVSRETEYERILELERKLGQRPEFAEVARYMQYLARPASPATENPV